MVRKKTQKTRWLLHFEGWFECWMDPSDPEGMTALNRLLESGELRLTEVSVDDGTKEATKEDIP